MKMTIRKYTLALCSILAVATVQAQTIEQDSTGLPGDNFSLEGALEMFKKAGSPEEFEKLINAEDNKVNNLDLNGDGDIDYIRVIDQRDGDAHALILRDAVSENESQDIAVIELDKTGDNGAELQIIGDEDIYGEPVIVEPLQDDNRTTTPVQTDTRRSTRVVVNVWGWPAVRYMYAPTYAVWVSPYGWRARPAWWRPWRPMHWRAFYPYRAPYRPHYVVVHHYRVVRAHRVYTPVRTTSVIVRTRHEPAVTHYRTTRTTRTVTPAHGRTRTTRTTTVEGKRGNVKVTKRSTRGRKRN
jgi:hypothetical protein